MPRAARAGWISVLAGLLGIGVGGALTIISSAGATTQPELQASVVECSTTVTYEVVAPDGDDAARTNGSVGVWWREGDASDFAPAPDELPTVNALTSSNGFTFSGTIETAGAPGSVVTVRAAALEAWGDGAFAGDAVFATVTLPPACDTAPPPTESVPPQDTTAPPSTDAPTTTLPPVVDPPTVPDDDGVPAEIEDAAPNGGDGNADGVPDSVQANVASLPSRYDVDGNGALDDYVTIEAPPLTALANVRALDVPAKNPPPDGVSLPAGLFHYDLDVGVPGQAADVRVLLPDGEQHVVYMLLDGTWRAFDDHASIDDAANQVTLHVVDGGPGDRSGADGVINDPFGVGAPGDVGSITFTKVATGGTSTTFNVQLARCVGSGSPPGTASTASDACSSVDSIETSTVLGGQSTTSGNLNTDNHWYRLRETPSTSGWTLSARSCTGGQSSTTSGAPSDGIFVRLNGGAGAVCTFTNASNSITARKGGIRIPGQNTLNTFVQGIDGAAFEYATNSSFSSGLADLCTTSSVPGPLGTCTQGGISNGTKYVREKTSPAGWDTITTVAYGGGPNGPNPDQAYSEQTSNLAGTTAATTRWFMNRMTNPPLAVDTCGLKIGLLLDKSQSISGFQDQYIQAAQSFVTTLANTPTQMKLYSFGINAQTYNGGSFYDLANGANVSSANTQISNIYSSLEAGTNWDAGLQQVGSAGLDVLFVITDGNPIMWQGNTSGTTVDLADVEAGIASANLVKSFGQRVVSIGVGDVTATNISLLSGPTQGSDYFTGSVAQLQQTLKDLAVSLCGGSVTVKKEVRTGPGTNDFAAASGWQYGVNPAATTVTPANGQTNQTGTVNFDYAEGPWPKTVTVTETQQTGYAIEQQAGKNATCTIDGAAATVTNTGTSALPGVSLEIDANDIVACNFRNSPATSNIQVVKTTAGGAAGPFQFAVTGPNSTNANRSATTDNANTPKNAGEPVTGLYPGSYTITESSLPAGWDLSDIVCTGATDNGIADVPGKKIAVGVGAGQSVTCTFTNSSQIGEIQVIKKAIGGEETFPFSLSQGGNPVPGQPTLNITAGPATPADDGTDTWTDVAAGTYAVSEDLPDGWDLTSATCNDGSPLDAVDVQPGETVICTVTNTKRADVTIVKQAIGAGGGADFDFSVPPAFGEVDDTLTLSPPDGGGDDSQSFSLVAGVYPVTEQGPPTGWDLTSLTCDDGSSTAGPTATIDVVAGESVTCTWTNTKRGSVTIQKNAVGQGAGDDFVFSVPPAFGETGNTVTLTTPGGGGSESDTFSVVPGSYPVTEQGPPEGWDLTNLTCTNGSIITTPTATIDVAAGEDVTCIWTNTQRAQLTIEKVGVGQGAGAEFGFDVPPAFGETSDTLTLRTPTDGGDDAKTFSLPPASYSVTEQEPPAGWFLSDLTCEAEDFELGEATATVELAPGEEASCTWTNTKHGQVTIVKEGVGQGPGAAFDFDVPVQFGEPGETLTLTTPDNGGTASKSFSVPPSTYEVTESIPLPAGWDFTELECTNGSQTTGREADIEVAAGDEVTCTWTNTKRAEVTIEKIALGDDAATFDFTVPPVFGQADDTLSLNTPDGGGSASELFSVPGGAYTVTEEQVPDGWDFTSLTCTNGDQGDGPEVTIEVGPGEQVTCTWTNTERPENGNVVITKVGVGLGDGAAFDFSVPETFVPGGALELTTPTDGGADSEGFSVPPNTDTGYAVSELVPPVAGWDFTELACTDPDGQNPSIVDGPDATIFVSSGETVTCTWTNTKRGDVTIEKVGVGQGAGADFDFSVPATFGAPDDTITLTTPADGGADSVSFSVTPGTYEVTEETPLPAGWDFSDLACTNESETDDTTADIEVAAGESVTCTWTNTKRADVTIEKVGVGVGAGAAFGFDVPGAFDEPDDTLVLTTPTDGGSDSQGYSIAPGTYEVAEQSPLPDGWEFTSLTCTNGSAVTEMSVQIAAAAGESVTCTWTNTKLPGTIVLEKTAIGEDAESFDFSVPAAFEQPDDTVSLSTPAGGGTVQSSTFDVPEGTYPVSELGPPEGWDLTDLTCTNQSPITLPTADIEVAAGGEVTCTWTNTQRADVTIEKVAIGSGAGATFAFDVPGAFDEPGDELTLTTPAGGGSDAQAFSVPPGGYPVTEHTPPAGWQLTGLSCTNGSEITSPTATITVAAGESVTCTWTNTVTTARVEVVKQVAGADVADWTFDGQVSGGTAHFTGGGTAEARTTAGDPPFAAFDLEQVPTTGASVHLAEQLQVGYGFAGVSCVVVPEQGEPQPIAANPDGATATPVVTPDQVVRCTFVNNLLPASISLVKTASASQVNAGSDTSFSIVVTNDGQVPLTNVVVTDPVPTGTTFVSATVVAGQLGVCSEAGGLVTCTLDGTLEVGETSTISLVVNVPAAATPFTIVNSATVTGDPPVCGAPTGDVGAGDVSALAGECPVTATDDATVPVIGVGGETVTIDAPRVVAGTLPFTGPAGAAALKSGAWLLALGGIITLTTRRRRTTR